MGNGNLCRRRHCERREFLLTPHGERELEGFDGEEHTEDDS